MNRLGSAGNTGEPMAPGSARDDFLSWAIACGEGSFDADAGLRAFHGIAKTDPLAAGMFCELLWTGEGRAAAFGCAMEMILAHARGWPGISLAAKEFEDYDDNGGLDRYWGWAQNVLAWSGSPRAAAMRAGGAEAWMAIGAQYLIYDLPAPTGNESELSAKEMCDWILAHARRDGFKNSFGGFGGCVADDLDALWAISQAGLASMERSELDADIRVSMIKASTPRI